MWIYEKFLEIAVNISNTNVRMAKFLLDQYGGPDGELSAALQYLNQRYTMPNDNVKALLTDIGTEELAHLEIIATMITKLIKGASFEQIESAGLGSWYVQHDRSPFYTDANGIPWSAGYISTTGDPVADLYSDIAAEERAKASFEHLIALADEPNVKDILKFLREREIVHAQRFKEAIEIINK